MDSRVIEVIAWTSDSVSDTGLRVAFWAFELADRLPRGWMRFVGYLLSIILTLPTIVMAVPFLVVAMFLALWEEANK